MGLFSFHCNARIWIKNNLVYMRNEVNKTIRFEILECWYYWLGWFIKYTIEITSVCMTQAQSSIKIVMGIQVILWLLPWRSERCSVVITEKNLCCVPLILLQMAWHNIHNKCHDGQVKNPSNMKDYLGSLRGWNVGITDEIGTPLIWPKLARYA
jgi:hypothetical protein